MRRLIRDISSVLIISGLLLVIDAGVTLLWQEPVTALIGKVKQGQINGILAAETISTLEKLYGTANAHFRHGMTEPFKLQSGETDFVYLTCMAGMLLFVRSRI